MNLADCVFIGLVAVCLLGAWLAVWLKNVFHNALGLILCLFGVAGLFIYLNAEFLAVMEVIIYIGAISIAIIFAIMLSRPWSQSRQPRHAGKVFRAAAAAALLFWGLSLVIRQTAWPAMQTEGNYSIHALGRSLLSVYALPFETVSVVLLVAIIGALVISGSREAS